MSVAFPYRVATDVSVRPGPWLLRLADERVPVPPLMLDWDCATDLTFEREVVVDREAFVDQAGLGDPKAPLALIVQWRASDSALTGVVFNEAITDRATIAITFTLSGRNLGGTLTLATAILLGDTPTQAGSGPVATHAGSVLWRDSPKKVRLTGEASRLPITVVDFRQHRLDPTAPWAVRVEGPLDGPAMGAIQLLLNSRRQDVIDLVESRDSSDGAPPAVKSALYTAVGRALVEHALCEPDLGDDDAFEDDALGRVLLGQVRLRFPDHSLSDLRTLRANEPEAFSALVDGRFGLFVGLPA